MRPVWLILVVPIVLILLLGVWAVLARPASQVADVLFVYDGDTIQVRFSNGDQYPVRYLGIDTPERGEWRAAEATQANKALVHKQRVRLEWDTERWERVTHRRPRLLAYVWVGDVMVNAELVRLGYARPMRVWPNVKYARWFEALARTAEVSR